MLICTCGGGGARGGCVASGERGGAPLEHPAALPGLPAVDNRENAANASGKLGGVAGVLHGVISC